VEIPGRKSLPHAVEKVDRSYFRKVQRLTQSAPEIAEMIFEPAAIGGNGTRNSNGANADRVGAATHDPFS
jgi:hypothetical protein